MITKELLDQVVAFEKSTKILPNSRACDQYTLHFRQWWKPKKILKYTCTTTNHYEDTFSYRSTSQSAAFHGMLIDHVNESYDINKIAKNPEKCPVLTLVPGKDDK